MMLSAIDDIAKKRAETKTMPVRCHDPRNINATYFFDLSISVLREEFGEPTVLLGVQTDKTLEKSKLNKTRDNLMRFRTIFNTAMAQIALFDGNGYMIDINDSACETFGIVDKKEFLESKMHISRVPVFHHMQHDIIDELWVSSLTLTIYDDRTSSQNTGHVKALYITSSPSCLSTTPRANSSSLCQLEGTSPMWHCR